MLGRDGVGLEARQWDGVTSEGTARQGGRCAGQGREMEKR